MIPKKYFDRFVDWKEQNGRVPMVSCHVLSLGPVEYYDYLKDKELNVVVEPEYPNSYADFVITMNNLEWPASSLYDTVFFDGPTTLGLLQRKEIPKWERVVQTGVDAFPVGAEYSNLAGGNVHVTTPGPVKVDVTFSASCSQYLRNWQLIYALDGKDSESLGYYTVALHRTFPEIEGVARVTSTFTFEELPAHSERLIVFLWNVKEKQILVEDVQVEISVLDTDSITFEM